MQDYTQQLSLLLDMGNTSGGGRFEGKGGGSGGGPGGRGLGGAGTVKLGYHGYLSLVPLTTKGTACADSLGQVERPPDSLPLQTRTGATLVPGHAKASG